MKQKFRSQISTSLPSGNENIACSLFGDWNQETFPETIVFLAIQCSSFKQLSEHAKEQWLRLPFKKRIQLMYDVATFYVKSFGEMIYGSGAFVKMLTRIFQLMSEKNLFISDHQFIGILEDRKSTFTPHTHAISSLGIITCDRPENLKKAIHSYASNALKYSRKIEFVICDDSKSPLMRETNKKILTELQQTMDLTILYAGLEEKVFFAQKLSEHQIPKPVIDFALFDLVKSGYSYGANCNSFYIHTAGELTFVTDDDTICKIAIPPACEKGLTLGEQTHYNTWFYPNSSSTIKSNQWIQTDILALHEEFLGKTLIECASSYAKTGLSHLDISSATRSDWQNLTDGTGHVALTHSSLIGDSGSNSPDVFIFSKGDQLTRMTKSEALYENVFKSREIMKASKQKLIKKASAGMSTFYGADNREIVPPFFPYFRNCDALFCEMFLSCRKYEYFAYLPEALLHSPPEARFYSKQDLITCFSLQPEEIIRWILQTYSQGIGDTSFSKSLQRAGEHILDFAQQPLSEFKKFIIETEKMNRSRSIMQYEELLSGNPALPKYMQKDIETVLKHLRAIPNPTIKDEIFEINRQLILRFGELLLWWPKIYEASKSLKTQGIRMATGISAKN